MFADLSAAAGVKHYAARGVCHDVETEHLSFLSIRVTEEESTATTMEALKARIRELERQILRGDRYKCLICMVSMHRTATHTLKCACCQGALNIQSRSDGGAVLVLPLIQPQTSAEGPRSWARAGGHIALRFSSVTGNRIT